MSVVADRQPDEEDPGGLIAGGWVLVDGSVVTNPNSAVLPGASVVIRREKVLRGRVKLEAALDRFGVDVTGRVALDVGASTGGFTSALLAAGAARVYAVDVGHGQLLGSLRQDPRVVTLESTNLADLGPGLVPDILGLLTVDLSFLALAEGLPQFDPGLLAPDAELVALVKPMYELHLAAPPTGEGELARALAVAVAGAEAAGWSVTETMPSPVTGGRGAEEFLFHARRSP